MTTSGFDVFISTGLIAAWRIRKADKEENEEVEVSRRQLRKLHKLWGVFSSRHLHTAKEVAAICISSEGKGREKRDRAETKKKENHLHASRFGCGTADPR